jgi:hypothetical protein
VRIIDTEFRVLAVDQNDTVMNARREELSRMSSEKFSDPQESSDRMMEIFFANVPSPGQEIARKSPVREKQIVKSESENLILKGLEGATKVGPEVDALYHECVVNDDDSIDPILALMTTIHEWRSLDALLEFAPGIIFVNHRRAFSSTDLRRYSQLRSITQEYDFLKRKMVN